MVKVAYYGGASSFFCKETEILLLQARRFEVFLKAGQHIFMVKQPSRALPSVANSCRQRPIPFERSVKAYCGVIAPGKRHAHL